MTPDACYAALGGSYKDVLSRLMSEERVKRFALRFLEDDSFAALCDALQQDDRAAAFRAAHTLKGVAGTLAFSALEEAAIEMTEALRPETATCDAAMPLLLPVQQAYDRTVAALREWKES